MAIAEKINLTPVEETVIEPVVAFKERNPSNWSISLLDDGDIEATCSGDYFKGTVEDFNVKLRG